MQSARYLRLPNKCELFAIEDKGFCHPGGFGGLLCCKMEILICS